MPHAFLTSAEEALFELARAVRETGYRFTTITPLSHERVNRRPGNEWAKELAGVFGWSRPFAEGALPGKLVELMRRAEVLEEHGEGWRSRVRFSTLGGQLFVHSAFPTTATDAVFFGPDTYRFAAAIESTLEGWPSRRDFGKAVEVTGRASRWGLGKAVEAAGRAEVRRAVDIGCGAGAGAILTALARPEAGVFAVDINDDALRCTRINAALAGVKNVEARRSDLLAGVAGEFDLIVANPPYLLDPAEREYRHGGGSLGAGLSLAIVDAALERLAPGGTLLLYTGVAMVDGRDSFRAAVEERLQPGATWNYCEVDPDVFGEELETDAYAETDRIAAVVLTLRREA